MLIKANDQTILTLREDMKRIWKQCWRSRWTMHELKFTIIDSWQDKLKLSFDRETLYLSKQGLRFENETTDDTNQEP